jgi:hypothetical protein
MTPVKCPAIAGVPPGPVVIRGLVHRVAPLRVVDGLMWGLVGGPWVTEGDVPSLGGDCRTHLPSDFLFVLGSSHTHGHTRDPTETCWAHCS